MKRILIIDDERIFPSDPIRLSTIAPDDDVTYARTSGEAIDALIAGQPWDEVWFDHDLGPDDDAMQVVKFMRDTGWDWADMVKAVKVHSMNPVGARNIQKAMLQDLGIPAILWHIPQNATTIHEV